MNLKVEKNVSMRSSSLTFKKCGDKQPETTSSLIPPMVNSMSKLNDDEDGKKRHVASSKEYSTSKCTTKIPLRRTNGIGCSEEKFEGSNTLNYTSNNNHNTQKDSQYVEDELKTMKPRDKTINMKSSPIEIGIEEEDRFLPLNLFADSTSIPEREIDLKVCLNIFFRMI